jgi:hypothetical protein
MRFAKYKPHDGQIAFHTAMDVYRYVAVVAGIRGGKTHSGAYEAGRQAWNAKEGVFGIVAPTYNMLDRTTWQEFIRANRALIENENSSKKIIKLKNGNIVHGHSADKPDRIRNETFNGAWVDEGRECKDFKGLWDVLLGRVLSTGGKLFTTTSPNGFDDIYEIFVLNQQSDYCLLNFPTYQNTYIDSNAIAELESKYDQKFARQEIHGEFVEFSGQVYHAYRRSVNSGDYALRNCVYDPFLPLELSVDFNVNPLAWSISQTKVNSNGMEENFVIDEIYINNSNTFEGCREFISRYPNHKQSVFLFGDATGRARTTSSNKSNYEIIKLELNGYNIVDRVRRSNPAERDRVNAVNARLLNSQGKSYLYIHPQKCRMLCRDFEQVSYKDSTTQIDKSKSTLTHISDALGYRIEEDYSLIRSRIKGLKI